MEDEKMIAVTAQNFISEENIPKFLEMVKELIEKTKQEKGCIEYKLYREKHNPEIFCLIEKWETAHDLKVHFLSEHFMRIVPEIDKIKIAKDVVNIYEEIENI